MPAETVESGEPKDPRIIQFQDPNGSFEITVRINNKGMDDLEPRYREAMTYASAAFAGNLEGAVNEKSLQQSGGTTWDVLRHILHRTQQVALAALGGIIQEDPEKIDPTSDTLAKRYARELAEASIKTQTGIEAARTRIVLYAHTVKRMAETIDIRKQHPKQRKDKLVKGLEAGMSEIFYRMYGMDEAMSLIEGKPVNIPTHIQGFVDYFGSKDQGPSAHPPTIEPPKL